MFCPDTFADITGSDTHWQDTAVLILVDNNRAFCAKVYCYNAVAVDISARVAGYISLVGKIEYRAAVRLAVIVEKLPLCEGSLCEMVRAKVSRTIQEKELEELKAKGAGTEFS